VRQREDRAVLDDVAANGSRLCGRFAPLAGMTAVGMAARAAGGRESLVAHMLGEVRVYAVAGHRLRGR